ncbi:MAG: toxin-antitoxin system HicB family antitoxin [Gemmatimonadetes bacterium]|nr:toxin-antitoxin system HicB family antitoxin [Gemmatimonadota bacterium]
MSALSLRLPHSLHERVRDLAKREGISINQFVATALAEKLSALLTVEYLESRAGRGSRQRFLAALAHVPASEPPSYDRLGGEAEALSEPARRSLKKKRAPSARSRR